MARSLSWIDSERLAALLEVVSPTGEQQSSGRGGQPRREDREDGDLEPERLSALFERLPDPKADPKADPAPAAPARAGRPAARSQAEPGARKPAPAAAPAPAPAAQPAAPAAPGPQAQARAQAPAPVSAPAAAPAIPAFQPRPGADLAARLEDFLDWVVSSARIDGALITDANGLIVVERGAGEIEPAMTSSIDLLLNHVSDVLQSEVDGYVALQRGGFHLVTLWTPTDYGRFYGVLISKAALHPDSLTLAGQGFRTLFAN